MLLAVFSCCVLKAETGVCSQKPKESMSYSIVVLMNEKSEILLMRRKGTTFGDGLYALPGGKIEAGETALAAALREVKEEVGITIERPALIHVIDRKGVDSEFYAFVFRAMVWQCKPVNCEPEKCDDISWFSLDVLPENIIPAHKQAIELYQKGVLYSQHGWDVKQ